MIGSDIDMEAEWAAWRRSREASMESPEGIEQPSPDRITASAQKSYRDEYAAAAQHALLIASAPWWRRALAMLPNPKQPLEDWVAAAKRRMKQ